MNHQERFAELWANYLEGELDEAGVAELRILLDQDEALRKQAVDLFQVHRMLGLVVAEDAADREEFVRDTLARLPIDKDQFVAGVMDRVSRSASGTERPANSPNRTGTKLIAGMILALCALGALGWALWPSSSSRVISDGSGTANARGAIGPKSVQLASQSHARFFGEVSLPVGAQLHPKREYVLMNGLIELAFPVGASAIIEGPAVFRVLSDESLALDVGRCSVHAPDGAEGFRVETPVTRVVDRGTRFTVNVSELSETEVQVIEGAADVYQQADSDPRHAATDHNENSSGRLAIRLTDGEAQKFTHIGEFVADIIPFDPGAYRSWLPDRVVSYEATTTGSGAKDLVSLTIQRGGRVSTIPVEDLIPAEVVWFKSSGAACLCGGEQLPALRRSWASDRSLITGVINPGGSKEPLTSDPVIAADGDADGGTPGMAVRFQQPVVNGPGADVVLFDLQTFSNPPEGDAFHVSPLRFRVGLRSHTIRVYDLTIESPTTLDLADFYVHMIERPINSLDDLETVACTPQRQVVRFRALAVGIDLSELGYAEGEAVDGLFLQDALDDKHYLDPVLIVGLANPEGAAPLGRID